jgi:phi13 family phage major tail protein
MANKVKYGLRNVYYAIATDDGTGTLTYATPVPIKGAVNLTMDAEGDTTPFYADNITYFSTTANNGYSGTLEVALIPDSFRTGVLGETADTNGVFIEKTGTPTVEFALLFQLEGDANATRHLFYRCTASRASVNGATVEASVEPQTETLNLTAMARISDDLIKARCTAEQATQYNSWFTTVYEPVNE